MRTTVHIADDLLRRAKQRAAEQGTALRAVFEAALRAHLGGPRASDYKLRWRTEKGRLQVGVNLEDRSALWDLMDGRS
jgi:hypothetical protein